MGKQVEVTAFTIHEANEKASLDETIDTHLISEPALAKEWLTSEEDKAWQDLQQATW